MVTPAPTTLSQLLSSSEIILLDGAMATELESLGVDTSSALWSSVAMASDPDAIRAVHRSYLEAGSRVLVTNSYQACPDDFISAGWEREAAEGLVRDSARLALDSVDEWPGEPPVVVAGSVGPYGAHLADGSEYIGDYRLDDEGYRSFHRPRLQLLYEAGIRTFAVETQPRLDEVLAVLGLLRDEFADADAYVSFSLADAGHLPDGTALADAARGVSRFSAVAAVGINCVPRGWVSDALTALRAGTDLPLLAYPNSGEVYDPTTKSWAPGLDQDRQAALVPQWVEAGARLLGGCCRTSPATIRELARITS